MFQRTCKWLSSVVFLRRLKKQKKTEKTLKQHTKRIKRIRKLLKFLSEFLFFFKKEIKLSLIVADGYLSFGFYIFIYLLCPSTA